MNIQLVTPSILLVLTLAGCGAPRSLVPRAERHEIAAQETKIEQAVAAKKIAQREKIISRVNRIGSRISLAGSKVCSALGQHEDGCFFPIEVVDAEEANAYADGDRIVITNPLVHHLQKDDHLAAVLAHEYAHNMLSHPQSMRSGAILGGILGLLADAALAVATNTEPGNGFSHVGAGIGASAYSQSKEAEADYVGAYIAAGAGFDVREFSDLWTTMSAINPKSIRYAGTHPSSAERAAVIERTIKEILAKRKQGAPLMPEQQRD